MSLKIKRYNANESDFTQNGRNKATFDIPASAGFSDLTQSKLVLDMRVEVKDNNGDPVAYPSTFGVDGEMVGPAALLRHSRVKSRQHGLLNERRHINVLDSNLDWYTRSRDQEDQAATFGGSTNQNYGFDRLSKINECPFLMVDVPAQGETMTEDNVSIRRAEISIPLKHIDQMASIKQFPHIAVGDLHYEVEFEDQFNVAAPAVVNNQLLLIDDATAVANRIGTTANRLQTTLLPAQIPRVPRVGDKFTLMFEGTTTGAVSVVENVIVSAVTEIAANGYEIAVNDGAGIPTTAATEACTNIVLMYDPIQGEDVTPTTTQLGSAADPLVFSLVGKKAAHHGCHHYPNQPVRLHVEQSNGIVSEDAVVDTVTMYEDYYEVTLNNPGTVTAAAACTNVYLCAIDFSPAAAAFTATWTIDEAYIELMELQLTPQQKEMARKAVDNLEIPWMEQRLLQKDMPATSVHTDVVHALPGCVGLSVLTPQNLRLLSGWDNCERYRFAVNGIEVTNRDVVVYDAANPTQASAGRQLHNHQLKKYWANINKALKKYDANVNSYTSADNQRLHSMYPLVLPMVGSEQTVQIQLFSDNGTMAQKSCFYVFTHPRVLKISQGRVQLM